MYGSSMGSIQAALIKLSACGWVNNPMPVQKGGNKNMKQIKLENSPIVYYSSGSEQDEWILFLHAAFVDHGMFQNQTEYFRGKFNVLTVDLIGHGQSVNTRRGDGIDKMSEWIHEILKAEGIEKIHIVGVSLGAVVAQDFANHYPDEVKSLACFGGYDINHFDPKMQRENSGKQMLMMLKALVSVKWFAKANKEISACTPQAQEQFYEMNIRFPKKSFRYLASLNGLVNRFTTGQRPYPLLIGCGQKDIPMELAAVEAWKAGEPDCEVILFENAGHCVNMDVPGIFNEALEDFLAKTGRCRYNDLYLR